MTFQRLNNNDIRILAELFTHPSNLPNRPREDYVRYARHAILAGIVVESLLLISSCLRRSFNITELILLIIILVGGAAFCIQYFILYLHKNYSRILRKRYQAACPVITDSYIKDQKQTLNLNQIRNVIFYQGIYFISSEKKTIVVKPQNATYEEFQAFFSQYADIVWKKYDEPFRIDALLKKLN